MIWMKDDQNEDGYFSELIEMVNQMKICGDIITEKQVVEKVMRSLTLKFDFIMVEIQESKDLKIINIE